MPIRVTAESGDSLCSIAVEHGFPDCGNLRGLADNRSLVDQLTDRPLQAGDPVWIPDAEIGTEQGVSTENRTRFRQTGAPVPRVRFVHGSADKDCADDDSLTTLAISNYVTTRAGIPENKRFPNHNVTSFDQHADLDVDAFKIEVHEPISPNSEHEVELFAMKPIYADDGSVSGHEKFGGTDLSERSVKVKCKQVGSEPSRFRSCYLRLVTDHEDQKARPKQTLLVTDLADGDGGENDKLEILDQKVLVSLPISTCPTGGDAKCQSAALLPIGDEKRRLKIQVHIQRTAISAGSLVGGLTIKEVQRHIYKWVRRTYAQADMGVKMTLIDRVDPLENLVSIYNPSRRVTAGNRTLKFKVNTNPAPTEVTYVTSSGDTPRQIADQLASQVNAVAGFSATAHDNPVAYNNGQSADIIVKKDDGSKVEITGAASSDNRTRCRVGRVFANVSTTPGENYYMVGSRDHRVLIRNFANATDCMHVFIIRRFRSSDSAVGYAYARGFRDAPKFQALFPVLGCCFVESGTVKFNDRQVHTTDHEIGHILADMVHFSGRHPELMTDEAVDARNTVGASKRITDRALPYREYTAQHRGTRSYPINPVTEVRDRENSVFIEPW